MQGEKIQPEIALQMAPNRMNMVCVVLSIVILHKEKGSFPDGKQLVFLELI